MNVCLISYEYPPLTHIGGIATYSHTLSQILIKNNCNVDVITFGPVKNISRSNYLQVHQIPLLPYPLPTQKYMYYYRNLYRKLLPRYLDARTWALSVREYLRTLVEIKKFDIIEYPDCMGEGAYLESSWAAKLVCRIHSSYVKNLFKNFLEEKLLLGLVKRSCNHADVLVSPSNFTRKSFGISRLHLNRQILVSPNPILLPDATPDSNRVEGVGIKILFLARIEYNKGLQFLLNALGKIKSHQPISLQIIGAIHPPKNNQDKEITQRLETILDKNKDPVMGNKELPYHCEYLKEIAHKDVYKYLEKSNLLVVPSLIENYPYTLIEGLSCGNFIIASDCGGIPEILVNEKLGLLFETGNWTDLQLKLEKYLSGIQQHQNTRNYRIQYMREKFNLDGCFKRCMEIYDSHAE